MTDDGRVCEQEKRFRDQCEEGWNSEPEDFTVMWMAQKRPGDSMLPYHRGCCSAERCVTAGTRSRTPLRAGWLVHGSASDRSWTQGLLRLVQEPEQGRSVEIEHLCARKLLV